MTAVAVDRLTIADAARIMREAMKGNQYARGTTLGPHVEDFLASKLAAQQFTPKTVENYRYALAQMSVLLAGHDPEAVTVEDLERVQASFPPRSAAFANAALSSFWKWMRRRGRVNANPADLLERPKQRKEHSGILLFSDAEIKRLEALPIRDGALMTLLFESGLRLSEAAALQLRDVDVTERELTVLRGKGGKGRLIDLSQRCIQRVSDLALVDGLNPDDHLWYGYVPGTRGEHRPVTRHKTIDSTRFYRWWRGCLAAADVPYRRPHTTRHTFAARWLRDGGRIEVLSEQMGHASLAITSDIYGHLSRRTIKAEVARLESLRFAADETPARGLA